ncbi:MAG: hypothetical protein EXR21_09195 [Flavobacteriaceae bacterium]|nr:hypothetical protein [Flavobacteriaceae bacterium]
MPTFTKIKHKTWQYAEAVLKMNEYGAMVAYPVGGIMHCQSIKPKHLLKMKGDFTIETTPRHIHKARLQDTYFSTWKSLSRKAKAKLIKARARQQWQPTALQWLKTAKPKLPRKIKKQLLK